MKKKMMATVVLAMLTLGTLGAQTVVCPNPNPGPMAAEKLGWQTDPRGGSGPMHAPGTGGGSGSGQRGPRC